MSEDSQGVTSTPPVQQTGIPKERLDELIQRNKLLEEQLQFQQGLLRQAMPTQQPKPQEEPEYLKRLKEENPAAYNAIVTQGQQLKMQADALFTFGDAQDRLSFVQDFGEEGKKMLPQVEQELQRLRSQGYANYNRSQLYVHLKGMEAIHKPAKAPEIKAAPITEGITPEPESNVPSTNPASAGTTVRGSTSAVSSRKTIEDMERELADKIF